MTLGLFFSLKPSLMMLKTSPDPEPLLEEDEDETDLPSGPIPQAPRMRLRRRSSMSDLDKIRKPQNVPDRKLGFSG